LNCVGYDRGKRREEEGWWSVKKQKRINTKQECVAERVVL